MTILVSAANGKTGRSVIAALLARGDAPTIRAFSRTPGQTPEGVVQVHGDLTEPAQVAAAVRDVDTVIHYAPPLGQREVAMGMNMIDAAQAAGVRRFIFVSVIHPEIDDLMNHQAKLAIEAYLINSRMEWTVLRPQHYMQNIDVNRVVNEGRIGFPYPVETVLGHVDMRDLAEATAKVAMEPGHAFATYDVDGNQHLSALQMAEIISSAAGKPVEAVALDPGAVIATIGKHWGEPMSDYTIDAFHRLFGYYARHGIFGNANVLTWLLGRKPGTFEDFVRRSLAGNAGPMGAPYTKALGTTAAA